VNLQVALFETLLKTPPVTVVNEKGPPEIGKIEEMAVLKVEVELNL